MDDATTLTSLLETLQTDSRGDKLSLDEVLAVIGERGYGPLMLILALIAVLPTGAVPGVPTACGISIALVAGQLAYGKRYPWLPARLRGLSIDRSGYTRVADRVVPWTRRIDRLVKPRLAWLTQGPTARAVGAACVVLALCMPPLELLPFAAALPASAIVLIGLGLAGKDGLWVVLGLAPGFAGLVLGAAVLAKLIA